MRVKISGLLVLMMTFSLVNIAYAKNEQPFRVVNMNDIADEGNQKLCLAPDTKTIQRKSDSVLIPAGTEFFVFPSEEERKKYFNK